MIKSIHCIVIADLTNGFACDSGNVDVPGRAHLSGDNNETSCCKTFTSDVCVGILAKCIVEDGIGDLITELVGVTFRNGFRGE